jgi:acyl dehydratase
MAHGFLTLALIPYLCRDISVIPEGTRTRINYGLNSVRLIAPVPVGSRIRDILVLKDVVEKDNGRVLITSTHTVEIQGQEKPACVAELLSLCIMEPSDDTGSSKGALL